MRRPSDSKTVRCAVYTRKSDEKGLEQEFNSLDAQREACEAYIASQRLEPIDQRRHHRLSRARQSWIALAVATLLPSERYPRMADEDYAVGHWAATQSSRVSWPA